MKTYVKLISVIAVLLLVVVSAGCFGLSPQITPQVTPQVTPQETPSLVVPTSMFTPPSFPVPTTQPEPIVGHVGDGYMTSVTELGTIMWGVDEVIRGAQANSIVKSADMYDSGPAPGYEYLIYHLVVKNIGDKSYTFYPTCWKLYENGRTSVFTFAALPDTYPNKNNYMGSKILPGVTLSCWGVEYVHIGSDTRLYLEPVLPLGNEQKYYYQF